jgi:hypothetical protein
LCAAVREGKFDRGIEDILAADREDTPESTRSAIHLFRYAWEGATGECLDLLETVDEMPVLPDEVDPGGPYQLGVWEAVRSLLNAIVPWLNGAEVHWWHPDYVEARAIKQQIGGGNGGALVRPQQPSVPAANSGPSPILPYSREVHAEEAVSSSTDRTSSVQESSQRTVRASTSVSLSNAHSGETPPGARTTDEEPRETSGANAPAVMQGEIRRCGRVWRIRFRDESGDYPVTGHKCLATLAYLLAHPNRLFTIPDLVGDADGNLAGAASLTAPKEADAEALLSIKNELDDVEELLRVSSSDHLLRKKEALLARVKRDRKGHKLTAGDPIRNAHHNIATQLRTFTAKKVKTDMPQLHAHIATSLKLDFPYFGYYPPSGTPAWKT